ncbi:MAG TPA: cation:proton antiporter [Solirubrobacterales bacterium]|nr:cation:proton antiporter [Solirubrobacterales bacterium]
MEITTETLVVVAAVAAAAPLLADLTPRILVPIVVLEMVLGILIGPELLGLAEPEPLIEALATFGLAFLFFLAGLEIEFERLVGRPARLGITGWGVSLVLGIGIATALWAAGAVDAPVLVGLALTTTALGTLMPILRDSGILRERFGSYVLGVGSVGELGPVVAVSLLLSFEAGEAWRSSLLIVFGAVAVLAAATAIRVRPARIVRVVRETMLTSGQFAIRLALLVIVALVVLAADLGLDIVLGAFTAGIVVGLVTRGTDSRAFEAKLDAIGFGFLIPIFFIHTGMTFDVDSLAEPATLAMLAGFAALLLVVRGLPALLLYRRDLSATERRPLALLSAAGLPLIVAITEIGTEVGVMPEQEAVALVGAGMLSVLVYPILALALRRRAAVG